MKKEKEDDIELVDLESEFNIKDEDIRYLIDTYEKSNVKKLKHHLKQVDDGINKIEEGILEVIYTVDEIIERYENGEIFREDCHEAINKLFIIADFTRKIENEFNLLKEAKDNL